MLRRLGGERVRVLGMLAAEGEDVLEARTDSRLTALDEDESRWFDSALHPLTLCLAPEVLPIHDAFGSGARRLGLDGRSRFRRRARGDLVERHSVFLLRLTDRDCVDWRKERERIRTASIPAQAVSGVLQPVAAAPSPARSARVSSPAASPKPREPCTTSRSSRAELA